MDHSISTPNPANLRVLILNFPVKMDSKMQQALMNVFYVFTEVVHGVVSGNTLEEKNGVMTLVQPKFEPELIIRPIAGRATAYLFDYWIREFVLGREHSLCFGVPRIGVDFLIYEVDGSEEEKVMNTWLVQNAIPVAIGSTPLVVETDGSTVKSDMVHSVKLRGFVARNPAASEMATKAITAHRAELERLRVENEAKQAAAKAASAETQPAMGGVEEIRMGATEEAAVAELASATPAIVMPEGETPQ